MCKRLCVSVFMSVRIGGGWFWIDVMCLMQILTQMSWHLISFVCLDCVLRSIVE